MGRDSPLGPSPSENTPPSAQGGVANRSGTQRVYWNREGGQQAPSHANPHPRAANDKGIERGTKRGTERGNTAPWSPPSPGLPPYNPEQDPSSWADASWQSQPPAGLGLGGHAGNGWSWPGRVGLWVAWGKGAQGTAGVMESLSPTAFSSSQTEGSLGTQALDPTAVTQLAEGHFISSSSLFS